MAEPVWTWKAVETLGQDGPPLTGLLPWRTIEAERVPIHVLHDGSLGLVWRVGLADLEFRNEQDLLSAHRALEHFLHQLPSGVAFQVLLIRAPGAAAVLEAWRRRRTQAWQGNHREIPPLIRRIIETREQHLTRLADDDFFAPKALTALVTFRWQPPSARLGLVQSLWRTLGFLEAISAERRRGLAEALRLTNLVETLARTLEVPATPLGGQEFLDLLWPLLNPGGPPSAPRWNPRRPLHEQAVGTAATFYPDGFRLGGLEGRLITLRDLPAATRPGHLTLGPAPGAPGALLEGAGGGWITLSGAVMDSERAHGWLARRRWLSWTQQAGFGGTTRVEVAKIHEEIGRLQEDAFTGGLRIAEAMVQLVVLDTPDRIQARAERTLNALAQLDCRALLERPTALPAWMASLPLGWTPRLEANHRRLHRLLSRNLADLLPLYGGWTGTETPAQLYLGRAGTPVLFDPFDSDVGMHMMISGATGAGKSFTAIDLCLQEISLGAHVVVLDKGQSYRRMAELTGGQYIVLEPNQIPTINPCWGPRDKDHRAFVGAVVKQMASHGLERFQLDPESSGLVDRAVSEAFDAAPPEQEVTLSDIAAALERPAFNEDRLGTRLVRTLYPFLQGGSYGSFFDGPNRFELRPGLTVIELRDLEKDPALHSVAVMVVLKAVTAFFASLPPGSTGYFVQDEAWSVLRTEYGALALELVARTYRKLRTAAVFISQFLTDFNGPAGEAVRRNCLNRLYLKQDADELRQMQGLLAVSDAEFQALQDVQHVRGRFAEGLLVTPAGRAMVRLVTDPITYWVATTHPRDQAEWHRALETSAGQADLALNHLLESVSPARGVA